MPVISVYMASDDHKWLIARALRLAARDTRTISWIVVEALREYLDRHDIEELDREEKQLALPLGTA